jgi:dolichol-phosphate mannosyltransferase
MVALQIPDQFDVIIVDGGSTDRSVALEKLQSRGVNTLLVKQSIGALGTQLQCAYDFALNRSYLGVITIDGNNKDNPDGIFAMRSALEDGVDFAQASRFIRGGKHSNTPLVRLLAVRLIHAPLLSLSSGFHWTDTTQGFRAYSRELLSSQNLKIFRPILCDYRLLFHISQAAPRNGLACIEIPSERAYPVGQVTPTKITGLGGLARVAKALILVVIGTYSKS